MTAAKPSTPTLKVSMTTLGCARNDVDSSELAGRLAANGWELVADPDTADVAVVNTCGFIEQAKKDSIDTILEIADDGDAGPPVVAIGCMAERYGEELADELPEAAAVLGFDSYEDMSDTLRRIVAGDTPQSHTPVDRRTLLPISPVNRRGARATGSSAAQTDGAMELPDVFRELNGAPWQPVKLASGCDRRCSFCAIPRFRGAFVSRPPEHIIHEVRWLAEQGVSEVFLVSENTTSYGKDLGDIRALESLLPQLAVIDGIDRIRVSYLQPAEIRPGLLEAMADTDKVAAYFDVSFQHAATDVLRSMRRFGSPEAFMGLVDRIRQLAPDAGIRSNMIVGFPGETDHHFGELLDFVGNAELDVCGVFAYSDEDGTEAVDLPGHLAEDVIADRVDQLTRLAEAVTDDRAARRVGQQVRVLIEDRDDDTAIGRAEHQGPDVDGVCLVDDPQAQLTSGQYLDAVVNGQIGADLTVDLAVTAPPVS